MRYCIWFHTYSPTNILKFELDLIREPPYVHSRLLQLEILSGNSISMQLIKVENLRFKVNLILALNNYPRNNPKILIVWSELGSMYVYYDTPATVTPYLSLQRMVMKVSSHFFEVVASWQNQSEIEESPNQRSSEFIFHVVNAAPNDLIL